MQRVERRYLATILAAWPIAYGAILIAMARVFRGAPSTLFVVELALFLIPFAAIVTIVVIGAPLRIVVNLAIKDRRRSHLRETVWIIVGLCLIVGYFFEFGLEHRRLAPPNGVTTLSAFEHAMPPAKKLELVENHGQKVIAWTGETSGPFDLTSGPSCYLFDHTGALVDWQPATGDGGPVEEFLNEPVRRGRITMEEALKSIHRSGAAAQR